MSVLVVDKPQGPTSFDVVRQVRGALSRFWGVRGLKVGHGGTLDPMASGVLPVCVGEGTKLAPFLLDADKSYEATLRFGIETDTLDAEGQVTARCACTLTEAQVEGALPAFRGDIEQVPPMYSALKRDGRPLYDYARAGETVERAARRVSIRELTLLSFEAPDVARIRVRCSKGTYVRTLAADLGRSVGPGAHLTALRRTASGPFRLEGAVALGTILAELDAGDAPVIVSLADALAHLTAVTADAPLVTVLRQGKKLSWSALPPAPASRIRVLDSAGELVAVVEPGPEERVQILRVFNAVPAALRGAKSAGKSA